MQYLQSENKSQSVFKERIADFYVFESLIFSGIKKYNYVI